MNEKDYLKVNKATWDAKTKIHVESDFYDLSSFLKGENTLNSIELNLLGNIKGKSILHLQCHFGQDSISLSRLGAKVCAVDFSEEAIHTAQDLADKCGTDTRFICSDVYALPELLNEQFDIVYTSYGTIGWLPDLEKWARVINHFLKPTGRFVFVEFHPVVWMFDSDFKQIAYSYFKKSAIIETESGTYANREAAEEFKSITWNHGLAEVCSALLACQLSMKDFQEYDYSPYPCFKPIRKIADKQFQIEHLTEKIPMVYSLVFEK